MYSVIQILNGHFLLLKGRLGGQYDSLYQIPAVNISGNNTVNILGARRVRYRFS